MLNISRDGSSFSVETGNNDSFWENYSAGTWEPETTRIINHFIQ